MQQGLRTQILMWSTLVPPKHSKTIRHVMLVVSVIFSHSSFAYGSETYSEMRTLIESQIRSLPFEQPSKESPFPLIRQLQLSIVEGAEQTYLDGTVKLVQQFSATDLANVHIKSTLANTLAFRTELDWGPLTENELRMFKRAVPATLDLEDFSATLQLAAFWFASGNAEALRRQNKLFALQSTDSPKSVSSERFRILACAQSFLWEAKLTRERAPVESAIGCIEQSTFDRVSETKIRFLPSSSTIDLSRIRLVHAEAYLLGSQLHHANSERRNDLLEKALAAVNSVKFDLDSIDHPGLWGKRLRLLERILTEKIEIVQSDGRFGPEQVRALKMRRDAAYSQSIL